MVQAFKKVANGPLWFGLPIKSISNSQVVLNVNAESLQLVVNASPGKIMFGQVSSPATLSCSQSVLADTVTAHAPYQHHTWPGVQLCTLHASFTACMYGS